MASDAPLLVRTLLLTSETPIPPTSGLRTRVLQLARQLGREVELELVALGEGYAQTGEPFALSHLPHQVSRHTALARSLRRPYLAARADSPALAKYADEQRWQTVQAELPWLVPAALHAGAPVVLDAHNVETEIARTLAQTDSRHTHRLRWHWEARKTERFERAAVRRVAAVCATSDHDAAVLESWGAREAVVVPNGVDAAAIAHAPPARGARLLYLALFDYRPNLEAAIELSNDVLPRVRATRPEAVLQLVGRGGGAELAGCAGAHIELTGEVPEIVPYLHGARALVVPLRAGSGTRLKVLEAMAAGLPVVSTPFGVAGLDVRDGDQVLLGRTGEELAGQAIRLIEDDELAERLSRQARALVERRYDWSIVAKPLLELHRRLAERS